MDKQKRLSEELFFDFPTSIGKEADRMFKELAEFIDPRTYTDGQGILKEIVKLARLE